MQGEDIGKQELMRVFRVFAITPLALVPLGVVCLIISVFAPSSEAGGLAPWFLLSPVVSYPAAWFLGLPLWWVLRKIRRPTTGWILVSATLIAVLVGLLVHLVLSPSIKIWEESLSVLIFGPDLLLLAFVGFTYGLVFSLLARLK
jgi:hypothetical protein